MDKEAVAIGIGFVIGYFTGSTIAVMLIFLILRLNG